MPAARTTTSVGLRIIRSTVTSTRCSSGRLRGSWRPARMNATGSANVQPNAITTAAMCRPSTQAYADATYTGSIVWVASAHARSAAQISERRRVLPEHVLHRAADLAQRAAVLERRADRRQQVLAAASALAQLLQALLDDDLVALGLERRQALQLQALGLGIDPQQVGHLDVVLLIGVHADDDVLADAVALLVAPRRLVDLARDELDRVDRAAEGVDLRDQLQRPALDLVGERLDEVGPG